MQEMNGFVLCGRYKATTSLSTGKCSYNKASHLKGHPKEKNTIYSEQSETKGKQMLGADLAVEKWLVEALILQWLIILVQILSPAIWLLPRSSVPGMAWFPFTYPDTPALHQDYTAIFCSWVKKSSSCRFEARNFWQILDADRGQSQLSD